MELTKKQYEDLRYIKGGHEWEFLDFLVGEKDVLFFPLRNDEVIERFESLCDELGLTYRYPADRLSYYDGNKVIAAHNDRDADAFLHSFLDNDLLRLRGKLLGYPECCVDAYIDVHPDADAAIPDRFSEFRTYPFYLNRFLRFDSGRNLISHFPCDYTCEESIEIAKRRLEILEQYNPDRAAELRHYLSSFVLYVHGRGVLYAPDYRCNETSVCHRVVHEGVKSGRPGTDEELVEWANQSDQIRIDAHNEVSVDGDTISGDHVVATCFSHSDPFSENQW